MLSNDRKLLLKRGAADRLEVELSAMLRLHQNMGRMYEKRGFEEAKYLENVQAGWYRKFLLELKGLM